MAIASAGMTDASADTWTPAIRVRRKALLQRMGMGAASALVFSPVIGWELCILWVLGYFLIQAADLWVFGPVTGGRTERLRGVRAAAGYLVLLLGAAWFGSVSIPLWLIGGPMAGVCASLLVAAAAMYAMINAPGSRRVLTLTLAPQFLYLAAAPLFMGMYDAGPAFVTAAAVAVGVFISHCLATWQRMNEARDAETAARLEAERKQQDAERIMDGRGAFLAAMGHDLRTPISAILAGSAELERAAPDSAARAQARLISDAGFMMKALLDDLLDHAKLEAGHMTVDSVDFDLRDLLNQTVRLWRGPARAKGLKLRVEGAAYAPSAVRGDPMRLRQVLNNLMSNAMKFTPAGSITLRLRAWPEEPGGYALLVEVADTGPGMTAEQLGRLFTPFDQTADGVSARHGGTGLGLAISRQLAELMGGRLTARSQPGEGATFTLALRLERGETAAGAMPALDQASRDAAAHALAARAAAASRPSPEAGPAPVPAPPAGEAPDAAAEEAEERPMRVLVVDDHDINRRAIQLILQPLGCDIATAADGLSALRVSEAEAFDLIFMDVRMPELDGRETTRRIRAGAGPNALTPVIAVTADTAPEDIAACTAAGMTYFVPKPITPQTLLGAINHVMTMDQDAAMETAAA